MLGWGVTSIVLGFMKTFAGIAVMRFILGAFEAGVFPGTIYCLTFWYRPEERAVRAAIIAASNTIGRSSLTLPPHALISNRLLIGGAFGGAIAFGIGHMNGVRGLQAWRWLFIIGTDRPYPYCRS